MDMSTIDGGLTVESREELERLIQEWGFLPFFRNGIEGFSIEELVPPDLLFGEHGEQGARRWLYPLQTMDADACHILQVLTENESMLSKQLKIASGFTLSRKRVVPDSADPERVVVNRHNGTAFDSLIAGLQMGTYVCIADFEYLVSKKGETYGWGVARYCTPEAMYDIDFGHLAEGRTPVQSRRRIAGHIAALFPAASMKQIEKITG